MFIGVNCDTSDAKAAKLSSTISGGKRTYKWKQVWKRRCFAACTTRSVSCKRKNREPFDKQVFL